MTLDPTPRPPQPRNTEGPALGSGWVGGSERKERAAYEAWHAQGKGLHHGESSSKPGVPLRPLRARLRRGGCAGLPAGSPHWSGGGGRSAAAGGKRGGGEAWAGGTRPRRRKGGGGAGRAAEGRAPGRSPPRGRPTPEGVPGTTPTYLPRGAAAASAAGSGAEPRPSLRRTPLPAGGEAEAERGPTPRSQRTAPPLASIGLTTATREAPPPQGRSATNPQALLSALRKGMAAPPLAGSYPTPSVAHWLARLAILSLRPFDWSILRPRETVAGPLLALVRHCKRRDWLRESSAASHWPPCSDRSGLARSALVTLT